MTLGIHTIGRYRISDAFRLSSTPTRMFPMYDGGNETLTINYSMRLNLPSKVEKKSFLPRSVPKMSQPCSTL
jgi:hypothetical protein